MHNVPSLFHVKFCLLDQIHVCYIYYACSLDRTSHLLVNNIRDHTMLHFFFPFNKRWHYVYIIILQSV